MRHPRRDRSCPFLGSTDATGLEDGKPNATAAAGDIPAIGHDSCTVMFLRRELAAGCGGVRLSRDGHNRYLLTPRENLARVAPT